MTMSVEDLHVALQQSFHPDASIRDPAEKIIQNLKYVSGATAMLLQVAAEKQVAFEVRQAAAIRLKNVSRDAWVERTDLTGAPIVAAGEDGRRPALVSPGDKAALRAALVEALLNEPERSVRDLLAETLHGVALHDWPDAWPDLLPGLLDNVRGAAADPLRAHNALLALRKICKRYEYKSRDQRGPLDAVVRDAFPTLLPLAERLSDDGERSVEAASMLRQILKIFWSSTQFHLPRRESDPAGLDPWFEVVRRVLVRDLPEAEQPTDLVAREQWPWWKARKWAAQIVSRLFSRYGMPAYAEEEVRPFARHFSRNVAPVFLPPVLECLALRPSGRYCTDRVVHLCLGYVDLAVELAPTYRLLKPHLDFVLFEAAFPAACLRPDDVECFENDPHEFVHRQNSPLADFYDPRASAVSLMEDLVRHRGRDVTDRLLRWLNGVLSSHDRNDAASCVRKDGALYCVGSLSEILMRRARYASEMEGLLVHHVVPDFESPVGFLRSRACWMTQRYANVKWTGTNLQTVLRLVLGRLNDPALPVQIEASKALRFLIEIDGAGNTLLPVLPTILSEYFRIMKEIGNDEVVAALQVIIDRFGDQIQPHAVALVDRLSEAFFSYCAAGDDDDDAAMAAAQCLECVATVLKGTCERPELYTLMSPRLVPLVLHVLGNDGEFVEYLEYGLDILTFLTFFPEEIAEGLWPAFPLLYEAFDNWAFDYLAMMVPPLENFIGKAPERFLTGTTDKGVRYTDLIMDMVRKTITNDRSTGSERRRALSLYMTVLHCTNLEPGGSPVVLAYLPAMNDVCLDRLAEEVRAGDDAAATDPAVVDHKAPRTRVSIFQVLGSALYYNPERELAELERRGATASVLERWTADARAHMDGRWLARKTTVLGLASVLRVPTTALPVAVRDALPGLVAEVVGAAARMEEDAALRAENVADPADVVPTNDVDVDDDDEEGFADDEDVTNGVDEAYMEALHNLSNSTDAEASARRFLGGGGDPWGDDDDDDLLDDDEENYTSPIDDVDQSAFVHDALRTASEREPEVFQRVQAALPPETVAACQTLFRLVEQRRTAAATAAAASPRAGGQ